jgi:hypothetical protein
LAQAVSVRGHAKEHTMSATADYARDVDGDASTFQVVPADGLIAGGAIAGVVQSVIAWQDVGRQVRGLEPLAEIGPPSGIVDGTWWPMIPFLLMALLLYIVGTRRPRVG